MFLPLPALVLTASLVPFAVIAVSMIGVTIFLIWKVLPVDGHPPLVTQMVITISVLIGGTLLLLSLLFVFLNSDGTEAWTFVLLAFNFMMMFPAGIWFVSLILFRDHRIDARGWFWPVMVALVVTGSEALMGVLFAYGAVGGSTATVPALAVGLSSVWFFWSMAAVMVALLLWAPLGRVERWALLTLNVAAILGPWVTTYPTVGGIAMAVLMGASFVALVRALLRGHVAADEGRLLVGISAAFLLMALAGFSIAATSGSVPAVLAFGTVMGVVMGVEVAYLIRRYYQGKMGRPWFTRAPDESEVGAERAGGVRAPALETRPAEFPSADR